MGRNHIEESDYECIGRFIVTSGLAEWLFNDWCRIAEEMAGVSERSWAVADRRKRRQAITTWTAWRQDPDLADRVNAARDTFESLTTQYRNPIAHCAVRPVRSAEGPLLMELTHLGNVHPMDFLDQLPEITQKFDDLALTFFDLPH